MFTEFRWMRILVFYDLPMTSKANRRAYTLFHKFLLKEGYDMLQFSVYGKLCNGHKSVDKNIQRIKYNLPANGNIRIIKITEKQYANMEFLVGTPTSQEIANRTDKQLLLI